jgi:MEMO1 family protein
MEKLDKGAIKFIENFDSWSFVNYVQETGATICGAGAIACLVEISKLLKAKEAKLLNYYTSGDVSGDNSNCVGYASMVIE